MVGLRGLAVVLATLVAALPAAPAGAAPAGTVGSAGLGDPFFPDAGNGGYDVQHYDLTVGYDPATRHLEGTAQVRAVTTQRLSRFDLDLRKALAVRSVTVDGAPARFARSGEQELVITPRRALGRHQRFTVTVRYGGVPATIT